MPLNNHQWPLFFRRFWQSTKNRLPEKWLQSSCHSLQTMRLYSSSKGNKRHPLRFVKYGLVLGGTALTIWSAAGRKNNVLAAEAEEETEQTSEAERLKRKQVQSLSLTKAIEKSRDLARRIKDESGSPGLVVTVSVDGQEVWSEGMGYSDVENRTKCHPDTVLRIASISKSITMAAVARLWENGDLDLDKPIQYYVPKFPEKTWEGEKVTITTRQLVSHMSGIRHYEKDYMKRKNAQEQTDDKVGKKLDVKDKEQNHTKGGNSDSKKGGKVNEMELAEYYIMQRYRSVTDSLDLFKDDPLVHKPDTKYLYTTHGWTVVSAVVEAASKTSFEKHIKKLFHDLGMDNTYLDEHEPLIYNRGRHYHKNEKGRLVNAAYVDLSYKWAGGGFLSTTRDLVKFGNVMLYSFQAGKNSGSQSSSSEALPGYLKPETMEMIWRPVPRASWSLEADSNYAMGWLVAPEKIKNGCCRQQRLYVSHTGAAIGGSSVLLILPPRTSEYPGADITPPKGVVVAMIVNMTSVSLNKTALKIAKVFEKVDKEKSNQIRITD